MKAFDRLPVGAPDSGQVGARYTADVAAATDEPGAALANVSEQVRTQEQEPAQRPEHKRNPRRRRWLTVDLGAMHAPWLSWCAARGTSQSAAVRAFVATVIADPQDPLAGSSPDPVAREVRGLRDSERVRREVRLTQSENTLALRVARAAGLSVQGWLIGLIRSRLTGQPQFGTAELQALTQSNFQLLRVSRELTKVRQALGQEPTGVDGIENLDDTGSSGPPNLPDELAMRLDEARAEISDHVATVARLIEANRERWRLR